jgi:hypothetical protein
MRIKYVNTSHRCSAKEQHTQKKLILMESYSKSHWIGLVKYLRIGPIYVILLMKFNTLKTMAFSN